MSEAAALHIANVVGLETTPALLYAATEQSVLTSRYEREGMLDIHRVKGESDLGVTDQMYGYIGALTGIILDPLNDSVRSLDGSRWDDNALIDQIYDRKTTQAAIVKSLLSKEAKTGKITNLSLEALSPEELQDGVLAKAETLADSQKSRQHFMDFAMYYALRGEAIIGGDDAEMMTFIGVFPYLGSNPRGDNGPRFLVKPFDAKSTDRSPQNVTRKKMAGSNVGGSTYRTSSSGGAKPLWVG